VAWLESELQKAAQDSRKVYLLGHISPGSPTAPYFNSIFQQLIARYNQTIRASFFGHEHKDLFRLYYSSNQEPIHVSFMSSSVTPGPNPSIRVYYFDEDTKELLDYEQYYVDLVAANEKNSIDWQFQYSAVKEYGLLNMSAQEWDGLMKRMKSNQTLFNLFYSNVLALRNVSECNEQCKLDLLCPLQFPLNVSRALLCKESPILEADSSWDCEFCKFVMNEIGHVVNYKESQQEFLKVVDLACDSASDAYTQKTCKGVVASYGPELLQYFVSEDIVPNVDEVCKLLSLCSSLEQLA